MRLDGYGLGVGCHGDLVLLAAANPIEAIRRSAARLAVIRRDRIVARSAPRTATLAIQGRPETVDFVPTVKPPRSAVASAAE